MPPNSSQGNRFPVKPQTPLVEELLNTARGILDRLTDPADRMTEKGAQGKLKENIGEYGARRYVEGKYGLNIKNKIDIPVRGVKGSPILDIAYQLNSGAVVVVEAKYDKSTLGKTGRKVFEASEAGVERVVPKPGGVKQFSPEWFQDRLKEIRKTKRRLANRLERAWMADEIEAVVIYVDTEGNVIRVEDHTERFTKFKQEGRPAIKAGKKISARATSRTKQASPEKTRPTTETASEYRPVQGHSSPQPVREGPETATKELTPAEANLSVEPSRSPLSTREPLTEEARPLAVEGAVESAALAGGARISRYRILLSEGIDVAVNLIEGLLIGEVFDFVIHLIFGDPDEERVRRNQLRFQRLQTQIEPKIKTRMSEELQDPQNKKLFEASPFDQFWFEVRTQQTWAMDADRQSGELLAMQLKLVQIVKWPGKNLCRTFDSFPRQRIEDPLALVEQIQECINYQPIFDELTQGQLMAASGRRLPKEPASHRVTRKQWLHVAYDYIVFAKKFPELKHLYKDAWNKFRSELCGTFGFEDLFTPEQFENCEQAKLYQEPEDKSETDDWRLRPTNFDRGTLIKFLNRKP